MIPVIARVGVYARRQRVLKNDSGIAISTPNPTASTVSSMCSNEAHADLVEVVGDPRPVEQPGADVREHEADHARSVTG